MELRTISEGKCFLAETKSADERRTSRSRRGRKSLMKSSSWVQRFSLGVLVLSIIFNGVYCEEAKEGDEVINESSQEGPCLCGVDRVPCAKNLTSTDCPNGRVIARRDCKCCFVCAKQLTEECNTIDAPCDEDYGLECGTDKRCKAKTQCSDDTSCPSDLMCVGGACADPCTVLPDVCKEAKIPSGICIARNHRALCSCRPGKSLNSEKQCISTDEEPKKCESDGRKINPGEKIYKEKCKQMCECEASGTLACRDAEGSASCASKPGFIPMSEISGEMSEACKILIGNDTLFDGCCVPETCQNVKSQDNSDSSGAKGGRDFKLTESHNNLGEDDEKSKLKIEETTGSVSATGPSGGSSSSSVEEKIKMMISVSKRTDHMAVIELPMSEKEAILSISLSKELKESPGNKDLWKDHRIPAGLTQITLSDLLPNTSYTLKYSGNGVDYPSVQFITDEKQSPEKKEGKKEEVPPATTTPVSSAEILEEESGSSSHESDHNSRSSGMTTTSEEVPSSGEITGPSEESGEMTTPTSSTLQASSIGCLHNGTSYEKGEIFFIGCDERCECMSNGEVKCFERCSIPFFKRGALSYDKMCYEKPSGVDDCCVLYACARDTSGAGGARELVAIPQPCDSVKCGPNAHCLGPAGMLSLDEDQPSNQTLCVCNDGLVGDPYDDTLGCQQSGMTTPGESASVSSTASSIPSSTAKPNSCVFKNTTYEFGAEHFDGCNYKCRCETSGEFLCVPRCNYRRDDDAEIATGCVVQKDPSDLECCEMLVCHGEPRESGTRKDEPTVPQDGCVYKNQTYMRDEKFYDGCTQQCMCYSNGDVTCQPRCPPAAAASSTQADNCVTLPDPTDKCCTVTVCGNITLSDVMKAANETVTTAPATPTTTTTPLFPGDETTTTTESPAVVVPAAGEGRSAVSTTSSPSPSSQPPLLLIPPSIKIILAENVNSSAFKIAVRIPERELSTIAGLPLIVMSSFDLNTWADKAYKISDLAQTSPHEGTLILTDLLPRKEYFFKVKIGENESNEVSGFTSSGLSMEEVEDDYSSGDEELAGRGDGNLHSAEDSSMIEADMMMSGEALPCTYQNETFAFGEEMFNGCEELCVCHTGGRMMCLPIDCPQDGGDILDESCLHWEPDMTSFKKAAPNCCPPRKCTKHSYCDYEGKRYRNYDRIPEEITGCHKHCECDHGNVTCRELCPPMPEVPPRNLPCPPHMARTVQMPQNECCFQWVCPPGLPSHSGHFDDPLLNGSAPVAIAPSSNETNNLLANTTTAAAAIGTVASPADSITVTGNESLAIPLRNGTLNPLYDNEEDQYVPPSTGNRPTLIGLDKVPPHHLQELLNHLKDLGQQIHTQHGDQQSGGAGGGGSSSSSPVQREEDKWTYLQVQTPEQVRELEKELGAKFLEQAEDGSFILIIPNTQLTQLGGGEGEGHHYEDQRFPPTGPGHHHGPGPQHQGPPQHHSRFPGGLQYQIPPGFGQFPGHSGHPGLNDQSRVSNIQVHPLNDSTLQIDFTVSPILVGLQGHVEVLYTSDFVHKPHPETHQWETKVFHQPEELIDNTHLQLFLTSLEPDTEYHLQIKVVVLQTGDHPTSDILRVKTLPRPAPPEIFVDPEIKLTQQGSKSLKLHWRKFSPSERELIDGIQVTYKANDDKVYSTTPLIHRSLEEYELESLQPNKEYEVNLLFIPFDSNQTTILKSQNPIFVKTSALEDEYNFDIAIESGKISESTVELDVEGVPHPEDKYVNIYEVIYSTDSQKEQKSSFKVPKRDTGKKVTLTDLLPGTNYTLWLQAFLTNGKKKRSNVISVQTKDGPLPSPEKTGQENASESLQKAGPEVLQPTSYYGALVALAIVAALSIIGIIALLMILIKKQSYAKAPINDRKSESSYDNPSFKSYDVELNGHTKPGDL